MAHRHADSSIFLSRHPGCMQAFTRSDLTHTAAINRVRWNDRQAMSCSEAARVCVFLLSRLNKLDHHQSSRLIEIWRCLLLMQHACVCVVKAQHTLPLSIGLSHIGIWRCHLLRQHACVCVCCQGSTPLTTINRAEPHRNLTLSSPDAACVCVCLLSAQHVVLLSIEFSHK